MLWLYCFNRTRLPPGRGLVAVSDEKPDVGSGTLRSVRDPRADVRLFSLAWCPCPERLRTLLYGRRRQDSKLSRSSFRLGTCKRSHTERETSVASLRQPCLRRRCTSLCRR